MAFGLDDALYGIAVNLVSSAIWDLARDPVYAEEYDPEQGGYEAYVCAVDTAVSKLEPTLGAIQEDDRATVEDFLVSDELRQLVMQLYRTRVTEPHSSLSTIREGARIVWMARNPGPPVVDIDGILDALVSGCDVMLDRGIKRNVLSAHEAMSAARHGFIAERLDSIERQLALIGEVPAISATQIDAFEAALRAAAVRTYSLMSVGFMSGIRTSIADVYVPPPFDIEPDTEPTFYEHLTGQTFRMVILGGPGAGKSTFARKLCRDLALRERTLSGGLRSAGVLLRLTWLAHHANSEITASDQLRAELENVVFHELQVTRDSTALEYLLTAGRLAVVFDGLDELPSAEGRLQVRAGLEGFAARYPLVPLIVTSRIVGYESAPLDRDRYRHARLSDYTDVQAGEFVRRWFAANGEKADVAQRLAYELMAETQFVNDLRASPLMLGLLCQVYRRVGRIAANRIDLYEACTTIMFHQVQVSIRDDLDLRFFRPALRRIAWWMLTTPSLGRGATEGLLVAELEEFLDRRFFASRTETTAAIAGFLQLCRGRPFIFAEVGMSAENEPIFHFTHRTFLEFFAGEHVATTSASCVEAAQAIRALVLGGNETVGAIATALCSRAEPGADEMLAAAILADADTAAERDTLARFVRVALPPDDSSA